MQYPMKMDAIKGWVNFFIPVVYDEANVVVFGGYNLAHLREFR